MRQEVSVPIRGLFNLTGANVIEAHTEDGLVGFRPH